MIFTFYDLFDDFLCNLISISNCIYTNIRSYNSQEMEINFNSELILVLQVDSTEITSTKLLYKIFKTI